MQQKNRRLSDLASLLSLSRCFVLRYMRWATSSMAHNLKNRPRFIAVRISKLKETTLRLIRHQKLPHTHTHTQPLDIMAFSNQGNLSFWTTQKDGKNMHHLHRHTQYKQHCFTCFQVVNLHHTHPSHYCCGVPSVRAIHFYGD